MAVTSGQLLAQLLRDIVPPAHRAAAEKDPLGRLVLATLEALPEPGPATGITGEGVPPGSQSVIRFLDESVANVREELDRLLRDDTGFAQAAGEYLDAAGTKAVDGGTLSAERRRALWRVFFPEALVSDGDHEAAIEALRSRRVVRLEKLNADPLASVPDELLFTSNVMLTLPAAGTDPASLDLPDGMAERLDTVAREEQRYFYDHPIPIGTAPDANELLYGLTGLAQALEWEKKHGHIAGNARLTVVLSVSVTHAGLKELALDYMRHELGKTSALGDLDVYAFTEDDTDDIARLLGPASRIRTVFGVDGPYGRHYSFLKAIAALWHVAVDGAIRATFKIDLDQVFPQPELRKESGRSAFEHFTTPLWGAAGRDTEGRQVELGMIAGALVNEADIANSLFTPDIPWPRENPSGEDLLFFKQLPMAISTRAEMMTRYNGAIVHGGPSDGALLDGHDACLTRVHVTGGTNGILVDHLRRYRPFTPGFIGRAEDQAYLVSVLFRDREPLLRYLHADGLIMRHDKHAFAGQAIAAAKDGTYVGDLVRTLYFSWYAQAALGSIDRVKRVLDPFTGCFITRTPHTNVTLRLLLHLLGIVAGGESARAGALLRLAAEQLSSRGGNLLGRDEVGSRYREERECWHEYYDAVDRVENDDAMRTAVATRISRCKLTGEGNRTDTAVV
jgi:hypothetical protein